MYDAASQDGNQSTTLVTLSKCVAAHTGNLTKACSDTNTLTKHLIGPRVLQWDLVRRALLRKSEAQPPRETELKDGTVCAHVHTGAAATYR